MTTKKSFTLIELIIVLAIIASLITLLITIIKPQQFFKNFRDTRRISDLKKIEELMNLMVVNSPNFNELDYASSNVVYISLPDNSATCSSYINELPSLPSGWSYRCSANPQNIDGTGWIPIPFKENPLINISSLPIDPINKPPYYYSFVVGGSYKVTAKPENNYSFAINDGGIEPILYEVGTNKKLPTFQSGLVGYWSFDEGTGTIAYDLSGYGNHGRLCEASVTNCYVNGPIWSDNAIRGKSLYFDGINDGVLFPSFSTNTLIDHTLIAWINPASTSNEKYIFAANSGIGTFNLNSSWGIRYTACGGVCSWGISSPSNVIKINQWQMVAVTLRGIRSNTAVAILYVNGAPVREQILSSGTYPFYTRFGGIGMANSDGNNYAHTWFNGWIDEPRIYFKALTNQEIKALYEATK